MLHCYWSTTIFIEYMIGLHYMTNERPVLLFSKGYSSSNFLNNNESITLKYDKILYLSVNNA